MKREIYFILFLLFTLASCKKDENGTNSATEPTIVYQDSLTVDKHTWPSDSASTYVRKFYQGHYLIRCDTIGELVWAFSQYGTINFAYSAQVDGTIQLDDPNQLGTIGIVFNYLDHNNYSLVEVLNNGQYSIWTKNNGVYSNVVSSISSAILTGNGVKNTIKIIQNMTSMELQINNNSITKASISMPNNIKVGIYIATGFQNYTPTTGLFNNFILSKI